MEELKLDTNKLNNTIDQAAKLPEVPRKEDNTIDLEAITIGYDEKNRPIIPDDILEAYYKELPDGTTNESNNRWIYNGGILNKVTREVQLQGAEALKAKYSQRRKLSETIDILLRKKASREEIEQLGLEEGATKQDALVASMLLKAIERGDVQASTFIRDTAGEKPSDKIDASITGLTEDDKQMIANISDRLKGNS